MMEKISAMVMPAIVVMIGILMGGGKRDYYGAFVKGAGEGLKTAVGLMPTLCLLLTAIGMLNASGAVEAIAGVIGPWAERIGVPAEILPLLLTRPFSGGASTAAFTDLLERVGADSFEGLCASVIFGSSDTMVYVITVYFSSVGIRKTRWAFPCAIAVMLVGVFFSCFLCRLLFA